MLKRSGGGKSAAEDVSGKWPKYTNFSAKKKPIMVQMTTERPLMSSSILLGVCIRVKTEVLRFVEGVCQNHNHAPFQETATC